MSNQGYKVIDIKDDDVESGKSSHKHFHGGKECNHDHGSEHGHSHGSHSHSHGSHDGHSHGSHGHSHGGHSHGHSHGHDHSGHSHGKWFINYGLQIRLFCYITVIGGWAMIVFYFNASMKESNPVAYWTSNALITFLIGMANISYYRCSTAKMDVPMKNTPPWAAPEASKPCDKCSLWKAERQHHCSACNKCNIKMDHHCPWITNCVGYHNHKAFWLYCFYIGICGLIFDYKTVMYFFEQTANEELFNHSLWFILWWVLECVAIIPFSLMVLGLSSLHFNFALNNMTTLESMGGYNTRLPCEDEETRKGVQNKFDKGLLANVCEFFHNDPLLFWWPTINTIAYWGQVHTKAPMIGPEEMVLHLRGGNKEYTAEEKIQRPQSLAEVKVQEIMDLAENFTKDKHLQFLDKMFEVGKRNDKTLGSVPALPTFSYQPLPVDPNLPPEYQAYVQQQMLLYEQRLRAAQERQMQMQLAQEKARQEALAQAGSEPTAQDQTEKQTTQSAEPEKQKEIASPQKSNSVSSNNSKKGHQDEFELDYPVKVVQTFVKPEGKVAITKEKEEDESSKSTVVVDQPEKSESSEKIEKSEHSELSVEKVENTEKEGEDFQVHEEKPAEKEDQ